MRPGGHLGVIWNVRDEQAPWSRRLSELVGGEDRRAAEGRGRAPDFGRWFEPAESLTVEHEQELDADRLVGLAASWSYVFLRPDRDEVLAQVRAIATDDAGPRRQVARSPSRTRRAATAPAAADRSSPLTHPLSRRS